MAVSRARVSHEVSHDDAGLSGHTAPMAIPDYQTLMLPVLRLLGDGHVRRIVPEITDPLGVEFHLTPEDHAQKLASGVQTTFVNRTHWATTYLSKAGLVSRPARGRVQITDAGRAALEKNSPKIDIKFLSAYPSFEAFRAKTKPKTAPDGAPGVVASPEEKNPEELLYTTYDALRQSIEADMLDRLQAPAYPWEAFERLVVELRGDQMPRSTAPTSLPSASIASK
jgi:restriction system protein